MIRLRYLLAALGLLALASEPALANLEGEGAGEGLAPIEGFTVCVRVIGPGEVFFNNGTPIAPNIYAYDEFDTAYLFADPVDGFIFARWEGDLGDNNVPVLQSLPLYMDRDYNITAIFTEPEVYLEMDFIGQGATFPEPGRYGYRRNIAVFLESYPAVNSGYAFERYVGNVISPTLFQTTIILRQDETVTAVFITPGDHTLTLTSNNPDWGMTNPPLGDYSWLDNYRARSLAIAKEGYKFTHWSGDIEDLDDIDPSQRSLSIFMDSDRELIANFQPVDYLLTVEQAGTGTVTPSPGTYEFLNGDFTNLQAFDDPDSEELFFEWQGDLGDLDINPADPEIRILMNRDRTVRGVFGVPDRVLSIAQTGPGALDPLAGVYDVFTDDIVIVNAMNINGTGAFFKGWTGDIGDADPTAPRLILNMTQDRAVTAAFAPHDAMVMVNAVGRGDTAPPPGRYTGFLGRPFSVTAITPAFSASRFLCWHGDIGAANPLDLTLSLTFTADATVSAHFVPDFEGERRLEHSADADSSGDLSLSEVLRVVQLYNAPRFRCDPDSEDGFGLTEGGADCLHHSADYDPQDWNIGLGELLRVIQLFSVGQYAADPFAEDGFAPGTGF